MVFAVFERIEGEFIEIALRGAAHQNLGVRTIAVRNVATRSLGLFRAGEEREDDVLWSLLHLCSLTDGLARSSSGRREDRHQEFLYVEIE